jgi:dTDP-4-dehydrorhamnose 3,5-epimerase
MRFTQTDLEGAFLLDLERHEDQRGFFARTFCVSEFKVHGLSLDVVQCNVAYSHQKGTLRGLHYQIPPATEAKLMRCTRGSVFDVIVDLRPGSATYLRHVGVELSAQNYRGLFVPPLFAHGYQTLSDETEVTYLVNEFYNAECERGLRYNDPGLGINWPLPVSVISDKDASWSLFEAEAIVSSRQS